jgi:hypothetical protein
MSFLTSCHLQKIKTSKVAKIESKNIDSTISSVPLDTSILYLSESEEIKQVFSTRYFYERAYSDLENMLNGKEKLDFKRAVFDTENAYFKEKMNYLHFCKIIQSKITICNWWISHNSLKEYNFPDSVNMLKNATIFKLLTDTIYLNKVDFLSAPIKYNFDDFNSKKEWSNQFVSTLLQSETGNCHSMPFLYKILANELGASTFLALAPHHIYLKNRNKKSGWYNTELTSANFPTDAWVKASGYITIESIRSGIYMDTLSQKQSVGLCVYDLAKGYLNQTNNYTDDFVLKCCNLVLKYHPMNINAMLLKAETLRKNYEYFIRLNQTLKAQETFQEMEKIYVMGVELGYREIPQEIYDEWIESIHEEQEKYINQNINGTFKTN